MTEIERSPTGVRQGKGAAIRFASGSPVTRVEYVYVHSICVCVVFGCVVCVIQCQCNINICVFAV